MGASSRSSIRVPSWLAPCLVGFAAFLVVVGPRVLEPTSVGWLRNEGDTMTYYLGWAFFRHSPWSVPLGLNPDYGLELGSSILYTDSIPLFALPFKLLAPLLPEPFQYFGLWILMSFVLQAVFAWKLVGIVTPDRWLRLAASTLFVFAPPALFRLMGHWALVAHWPILAALFLQLRPSRERQTLWWALLTACAALVHTYIIVMVMLLWASAWVGDAWTRRRGLVALAGEAVLVPAFSLFAQWQAGFFVVGEGKSGWGFGFYRMNLNAPVNAFGWSYLLPTLDWGPGDYEGFAFFGLGGLALAALALPAVLVLIRRGELSLRREWLPLGLLLLAFTVVAASNKVGLGLNGFTYAIPRALEGPAGMLRSSGRLFWPVYYLVFLAVLAAIIRAYRAPVSLLLIVAALVVQVVDTSPGWRAYQAQLRRRGAIHSPLTSAFWYEAPSLYRRVRLVPPGNLMENWAVIADYAQRQGLPTDAIYTARVDATRVRDLARRTAAMLEDGTFDPETLYILQGGAARRVPCVIDPDRDQLSFIDGFWVLMPGWKTRFGDRFVGQQRLDCPVLAPGAPPIEFVSGSGAAATLTRGWSTPETWGTWSEGPVSVLSLRVTGQVSAIDFAVAPAIRPGPPLEVQVSVDGRLVDAWLLAGEREPRWYRVALPDAGTASLRRYRIRFAYSDTRPPASFGNSKDRRPIALALWRARAVE